MTESSPLKHESSQNTTDKTLLNKDAKVPALPKTNTRGTKQSPTSPPAQYNNNPAKVHMGKANIKRDVSLFVGFIAVLLFIATGLDNVHLAEDPDAEEKDKIRDIQEMKQKMEQKLREQAEAKLKPENEGCGLFLTQSSIPDVGQSLFAGLNFTKGDVVLESELSYPVMTTVDNSRTFLSAPALLLKFHPYLANVVQEEEDHRSKGSSSTTPSKKYIFRATRPIQEGEEIFVSRQSYHEDIVNDIHLFDDIPLISDYEIADQIALEEALTQIKSKSNKRKKGRDCYGSGGGNGALDLVQRAVSRFNERVAKVLPTNSEHLHEMKRYQTSMAFLSLQNVTMWRHQSKSSCVTNVVGEQQGETTTPLVATRKIQKRGIITTVPLYVMKNEGTCQSTKDQTCDTTGDSLELGSTCFGNTQLLSMVFCPLLAASLFSRNGGGFASKDPLPGQKEANARYAWSKDNIENEKAHQYSADLVTKNFATKLSIDIIATRIINEGEEIVLDFENGQMKDDMIPSNWTNDTT
eukprot:CAMPEP_0195297532 /NCGR_PEP_ID=MMETSP0707-20130614/21712_1 /TAXON_ID=33640 /ORGANISM="Asterionellopsis glacialis, Strain CCMP134" /LENGTH=521 /DNA_ID=CAMNT_0040359373 /DNA_START=109 /DNA_END=1674 /DNA_ORIENTATION=+